MQSSDNTKFITFNAKFIICNTNTWCARSSYRNGRCSAATKPHLFRPCKIASFFSRFSAVFQCVLNCVSSKTDGRFAAARKKLAVAFEHVWFHNVISQSHNQNSRSKFGPHRHTHARCCFQPLEGVINFEIYSHFGIKFQSLEGLWGLVKVRWQPKELHLF